MSIEEKELKEYNCITFLSVKMNSTTVAENGREAIKGAGAANKERLKQMLPDEIARTVEVDDGFCKEK